MDIRHASILDLDEITEMEKRCFPKKEAASKESFKKRIQTFPMHFWLLKNDDGEIISGINGMTTDIDTLTDEMYSNYNMHDENGAWQMIFGVTTLPEYQHKGYASLVMKRVIDDCKLQNKKGIVLTCKDKLIKFYEQFGFVNKGVSASEHGGAIWYEMRLEFD